MTESSPVAPCSCVTLPSSPGSMLAMETLARLVMLDREKEEETGMLKHDHHHYSSQSSDTWPLVCILMPASADPLQCRAR